MEQTDIPPFAQVGQEGMQSAWSFGKFEAVQLLVLDVGGASAGEVAGVGLGHLVGAEVDDLKFWVDVWVGWMEGEEVRG